MSRHLPSTGKTPLHFTIINTLPRLGQAGCPWQRKEEARVVPNRSSCGSSGKLTPVGDLVRAAPAAQDTPQKLFAVLGQEFWHH